MTDASAMPSQRNSMTGGSRPSWTTQTGAKFYQRIFTSNATATALNSALCTGDIENGEPFPKEHAERTDVQRGVRRQFSAFVPRRRRSSTCAGGLWRAREGYTGEPGESRAKRAGRNGKPPGCCG